MRATVSVLLAAAAACTTAALPAGFVPSVANGADTEVGWNTVPVEHYTLVARGKYNGTMYAMQFPSSHYNMSQPPLMIDLHGTPYQQGNQLSI
jgi:hypothetical protein